VHPAGGEILQVAFDGPHDRRRARGLVLGGQQTVVVEDPFAECRRIPGAAYAWVDGRAGEVAQLLDPAVPRNDHEEVLVFECGQADDPLGPHGFVICAVDDRQVGVTSGGKRADVARRGRVHWLELIARARLKVTIEYAPDARVRAGRRAERNPYRPAAASGQHLACAVAPGVEEVRCDERREGGKNRDGGARRNQCPRGGARCSCHAARW
jgi:hypothetical protein